MKKSGTQAKSAVRKIVGLNLNLQVAKRRLAELERVSAEGGDSPELQSIHSERGKLQGEIDYCITAIKELQVQG